MTFIPSGAKAQIPQTNSVICIWLSAHWHQGITWTDTDILFHIYFNKLHLKLESVHSEECIWKCCLKMSALFVQGTICWITTQIARFMGPTWGPPGSCWPHVGPMLVPWILLSGNLWEQNPGYLYRLSFSKLTSGDSKLYLPASADTKKLPLCKYQLLLLTNQIEGITVSLIELAYALRLFGPQGFN